MGEYWPHFRQTFSQGSSGGCPAFGQSSFLCPGDHAHSDREQVTLGASSQEQLWQQGGRAVPRGLLLQIWPYLASCPSVPIGAPTLQTVYPTWVWRAGPSRPDWGEGLLGGAWPFVTWSEGSGCPGGSPRVHLQMTGGPIPTWGQAALAHFHPENWACWHWTALLGDPAPFWACRKHSTRRRRLLEKPSSPPGFLLLACVAVLCAFPL